MIGRLFWLCVGSVFYTYAGYPLILSVLARLRPPPRRFPPPTASVTLLIAAYKEEDVIAQKLDNSLALDYPREHMQILVAADGSDDGTADIVRTYADRGVELSYRPERRGKMAAINRAMQQARGSLVVFSDANNHYHTDALQELLAPFADPTIGAVTGAKTLIREGDALSESEGIYWKYESFIKKQETRLGCCTGVVGEMLAIRRDLFEPLPEHTICDDFSIAMRIIRRGYRVVYAPRALSSERISLSEKDEITRRTNIVAGRYQAIAMAHRLLPFHNPLVVWQVVSHKFLRPLVPLAMIGALVCNLVAVVRPPRATAKAGLSRLLRLAPPFNLLFLLLQSGFYGLAWLGQGNKHKGILGKMLYLPTFLVNSNIAALSGLYRFITRRQTVLWQRVQRRVGEPESPGGPGGNL